MGDTSPKNIHKLEEQQGEEKVEKELLKKINAEAQHHPASGHAANPSAATDAAAGKDPA